MKQFKKNIFAVTLLFAMNSQSQNKALIEAFSQSYNYEAIAKYEAAITSLNAFYSDKSY